MHYLGYIHIKFIGTAVYWNDIDIIIYFLDMWYKNRLHFYVFSLIQGKKYRAWISSTNFHFQGNLFIAINMWT